MRVRIEPSMAFGSVTAPPSKSLTHRALICGACTEGSTIHNVVYSQDVEATLRCLEAMGARVKRDGSTVYIGGLNPLKIPANTVLDCAESGSTLRFLLPLCLLSSEKVRLTGSQRLLDRPIDVYEDLCQKRHLTYLRENNAIVVKGPLTAGEFRVRGDVSSQFISGLLMALPLLGQDSMLSVEDPFESKPYARMTEAVLNRFGIVVSKENTCYHIRGIQEYASCEIHIDGDYSNAAYLEAYNLLGGDVKVLGLTDEKAQGDRVYKAWFDQLTTGIREFNLVDSPDLGPIMFALAAICGEGRFDGVRRLRLKESDRIEAMSCELKKFGVVLIAEKDEVVIRGHLSAPTEALDAHNDHRIVMALALLCSKVGGVIDGAEAVAKSFPHYFDVVRSLGVKVIEE